MTKERLLSEAQISLGVALPLHHKDTLKMFFILASRGTPIADVIDILAEMHGIKAPTPHSWEHVLPERKCIGCGTAFQPLTTNQTYHNVGCREEATARRQSEKTRQKHLAFVADAKAAATAELVEEVVAVAITIFDTEAAATIAETIVEETTTEEPDTEEPEQDSSQSWALGRSITERNNPDEK